MIGTMIFIGYLLIGAILGRVHHKMFEEIIGEGMAKMPSNVRGIFVALCVIVIIFLAPLLGLYDVVVKLKPKRR